MDYPDLEEELRSRARKDADAEDFYARYTSMKKYLDTEYYPWIQATCPFFTDHGRLHITSVLHATSQLLGGHLTSKKGSELTTLDLFVLMSAVLWHDVGMVYGRSGHAARVAAMTQEVRKLGFPNPDVQRIVNEISLAHAGNDGLDKARQREDVSTATRQYTVYPSALAALLRFADEVSENQARISHALIDHVPNDQRIYWEYASCVAASIPDPTRRHVRISVNVPHSIATKQYDISDAADACQRHFAKRTEKSEITVIEYIISRLEKMNNERAYCAPRFSRYVDIRELEIVLTLTRDNQRVDGYQERFILGDGGLRQSEYPSIDVFSAFFHENDRWTPERLMEKVAE